MPEDIITRRCWECHVWKVLAEFYTSKRGKYGRGYDCKECHDKRNLKHRDTEAGRRQCRLTGRRFYHSEKGALYRKQYRALAHVKTQRLASNKRYISANVAARKAHDAVKRAVNKGRLPRPSSFKCSRCNNPARHYHHESYGRSDWLNVTPICARCHKTTHAKS